MKTTLKIGIVTLIIVVFSLFVNAFGVSSSYWKDNPLIMHAGQTEDVKLLLQNMVGEKDMKVKISIVDGKSFAKLLDKNDIYNIPFGVKDVPINIRISIPENANLGENLNIGVMIIEIPTENKNMIQTAAGIRETIPILIRTESEVPKIVKESWLSSKQWDMVWVVLIIIVVVVILLEEWHLKNKKKKKRR